jgi:hypothetical protein
MKFENIMPLFTRKCEVSFHEAILKFTPESEKDAELAWSIKRPASGLHGISFADAKLLPLAHYKSLIPFEKEIYLDQHEKHVAKDKLGCCYMLNQDSRKNRGIASGTKELHSIIKNPTLHFVDDPQDLRWLTPRDCLRAQGFFVDSTMQGLRSRGRSCSWAPGGAIKDKTRKRNDVFEAAGNSMTGVEMASAWMHAFLNILPSIHFPLERVFRPRAGN